MPVKINGASSGSVTLAAPASGSDVTLTLPAAAGTVALTASQTLSDPTLTGNVVWSDATLRTGTAFVATNQTTTSTSYADLATVGPSVTLTTGTKALVLLSSGGYNTASGAVMSVSVAVSGASTIAASDDWVISRKQISGGTDTLNYGSFILFTNLTAGSNTFTLKYSVSSGTGNFNQRRIAVVDMGS